MFFLFFVAIIVLAMVGLGSVLGTGVGWIAAAVLLPLLLIKVLFVLMMFGFVGRKIMGSRSWAWDEARWSGRPRPRRRPEASPSREERFEEWHRMAHAREEVDGWVSDLDDTGPE